MTRKELFESYKLYNDDVYNLCCCLTKNTQDRDDLFQDTFLLACRKADKINPAGNVKSYLLSLTVGLWRNRSRLQAVRKLITGEFSVEDSENFELPDTRTDIEESVIKKEEAVFLRKATAALPDKYRIPVYLHYLEDLNLSQISECLRIPVGTVKSRLNTARKLLKKQMEAAGYDR